MALFFCCVPHASLEAPAGGQTVMCLQCSPPLCYTGHPDPVCRDHCLLPRSFEPPHRSDSHFFSGVFAASTNYLCARSGEVLFKLFTVTHPLAAARLSSKSPCFFIASLFSVQQQDANVSFSLLFVFVPWPLMSYPYVYQHCLLHVPFTAPILSAHQYPFQVMYVDVAWLCILP